MTVSIAGELTGLGSGAAVVVDKEGKSCTESCIAGPSCEPCDGGGGDDGACLTRTLGFWGTHPHIAAEYDPVTVCGKEINGQAANTCSTSEALCSSNNDYKANSPYLQLIAQLTAAKLNLNATATLFDGATCNGFEYEGDSIRDIIARCETAAICGETKIPSATAAALRRWMRSTTHRIQVSTRRRHRSTVLDRHSRPNARLPVATGRQSG